MPTPSPERFQAARLDQKLQSVLQIRTLVLAVKSAVRRRWKRHSEQDYEREIEARWSQARQPGHAWSLPRTVCGQRLQLEVRPPRGSRPVGCRGQEEAGQDQVRGDTGESQRITLSAQLEPMIYIIFIPIQAEWLDQCGYISNKQ